MLLGQLYYYEKELGEASFSGPSSKMLDIEIAGIDGSFIQDIKGLTDPNQILIQLKESFISNYELILIQNNLQRSLSFWKWITSPVYQSQSVLPVSKYQQLIADWLGEGSSTWKLKNEILADGKLLDDEGDFALYYGLHVLYKINTFLSGVEEVHSAFELTKPQNSEVELSDLPQIIIVGSTVIQPLITNINCLFLNNSESRLTIKNNIIQLIQEHPSVNLVLIDFAEASMVDEISRLKLEGVLVSEINFQDIVSDSYFENLVKKTLGVRLV